MLRWATKDQYERETEEADRLVRPAPKIKPPRTDRRREEVRTDQDPDVEGDVDVAKDPDLSLNYKSIGGSMARRIVARFQFRAREFPSQKALNEYLKEHPDADPSVHSVKEKEEEKAKEEKPAEESGPSADEALKGVPSLTKEEESAGEKKPAEEEPPKGKKLSPEELADVGRQILEDAKSNSELKSIVDQVLDETSAIGGIAKSTPKYPIGPFFRSEKAPEGLKTIGDLLNALTKAKKPKPKGKKPPAAPKPPAAGPAAPKPPETKLPAPETPSAAPATGAKPEEKAPEKPAPTPEEEEKAKKTEQSKKIVERFLSEKKDTDPAWQKHIEDLPTTVKDESGKYLFYDRKKKGIPFEELPDAKKAELIDAYEEIQAEVTRADDFQKKLQGNDEARETVEGIFDPESAVFEKLEKLKEKYDLNDLPVSKHLPELVDVLPKDVQSIGDLQKLVSAHPDVFRKQTDFDKWVKDGGPASRAFTEYAQRHGKADVDEKTGKLLFTIGKKKVPWAKLDDETKAALQQDFQNTERIDKWSDDIRALARIDNEVAHILRRMVDPRGSDTSNLDDFASAGLEDPELLKTFPALRDIAFPPDMTFGDLVEISKDAFKPVPPPRRSKVNAEDVALTNKGFKKTFKDDVGFAYMVQMANLHPADLTQIMRDYDGFKNEKLKPDDVEKRIEDMQRKGLYCTDPRSVVPPKSGLDKKGNPKPWDALDDNEKAEAYAKYRNSVMAASFALRKQVISTYKDMGLPENVAKTLAMTKLSRRPGETLRDRAARSEDVADQVFDEILSRNQPPREYTPDEIKTTMELAGLDPMAKNILVAEFQAIDYLRARQKYLHGAPEDQIDERDSPRSIVARLREASDELRKSDKKYPPAYRRQSMAETFRKRVLTRLMALNPDKASKIEPEFRKMDADDYDTRKAEVDELTDKFKKDSAAYEKALERIQKEFNDERAEAEPPADGRIYRMTPVVQSVKKRLAEEGIQEPIPPPLLPDKPAGYDEIRSSPRGIVEKGKKLWNLLRHGLPSKSRTASERIVDRYLAFSTCEPGLAMGTPSKHNASVSKTGLYWGVDQPSKGNAVNVPYASWGQAHARDLGEKDYGSILTAAREWLKVPVLSRVLDVEESLGAAHDIQLRAALDLAIRDHEGGKYSVGLHPTVYNNLLARLAGKPTASPLLTQREASKSLYIPATGEDSPMNAASKIRKMAADIVAMNPGLAFDLTNLAFEVQAEQSKSAGEIPEAFKENIQKKKDEAKDKDQGQEQDKQASGKYAALRTAVIRTAAQNPTVRPALVPILQMIKEQG